MPSENYADLEIALHANFWLYVPPLALAANAAFYGTWMGWLIVSVVLGRLFAWALMRAQYVRLAAIPDFPSFSVRNDRIRSLCAEIARGLRIADGGGA